MLPFLSPKRKYITNSPKSLAEQLSYLHLPKPFKNPSYAKHVNRRVKNLKTVLGQERERERADRERRRQEKVEAEAQEQIKMEVDGEAAKPEQGRQQDEEETPTCKSATSNPQCA